MQSMLFASKTILVTLLIVVRLQSMDKAHLVIKMPDGSSRNVQLDFNNVVFRNNSPTVSSSSSTSGTLLLTRSPQSAPSVVNDAFSLRHNMPMSTLATVSSSLQSEALSAISTESLRDTSATQDLSSSHQLVHVSGDSSGLYSTTLSCEKLEATLLTEGDTDEKNKTDANKQEANFHDWMQLGQIIRSEYHMGELRKALRLAEQHRRIEFLSDSSRHIRPQNVNQTAIAHICMQDLLDLLISEKNFAAHVLINKFPLGDHIPPDIKQVFQEMLDRVSYAIYETTGPSMGKLKPSSAIDLGVIANIYDSYKGYCSSFKYFSNWPVPVVLQCQSDYEGRIAKVKRVEDYGFITRLGRSLNSADYYEFMHAIDSNTYNIQLLKLADFAQRSDFKQVDAIALQAGIDKKSSDFQRYIGMYVARGVHQIISALGTQVSQDALDFTDRLVQNIPSHQERVDFIICKMTKDSPLYREFFHESGICKLIPARITISEAVQQQLRASIGKADAAPERTLLNKLVSVQPQDSQVVTAAQVGIDYVAESFRFGSYDKDLSRVYFNNARHVYNECLLSKPRIALILKHFKDHYASLNQAKIEQILLNIIDQLGTYCEQYPHSDRMQTVNDALERCLNAELLNRQGKSYESYQAIKDVAELLNPIEEFDFLTVFKSTQLDQVAVPTALERMVRDQTRTDLAHIEEGGRPAGDSKVTEVTHESLDVLLNQYDQRAQQKLSVDVKEAILIRRALIEKIVSQAPVQSIGINEVALKGQLLAELDELAYLAQSAELSKYYPQSARLIEERGDLARYHLRSGNIFLGLSQVDDCWQQYELVQNDLELNCKLAHKSHLAFVSQKEIILSDIAQDLLNSRDIIGMFKSINEERYSQEQRSLSHLVKKLVNDTADASYLSKIPKEARELAVSEALICASAAQEFIDQGHLRKPAQLLELGFAILEKQSQYSKIFCKSAYQRVVEIATHPIDFIKEQAIGLAHLADLALRGLHFAQRLSFSDPLSWRDSINAWKQAGEVGISITQASRELVAHAGAMTAAEWDAQIKSIIAHAGRGTVDLLAADLLLSGAGEGAAVLKSRTEKLIRSIPPERLNKFSQSLGKTRVIWDKAAEGFGLERAPVPALAGEAGALEGLSLAEQEAAVLGTADMPASSVVQYDKLTRALREEEFTSIIKVTKHGLQRLIERGFTPEEVKALLESPDLIKTQLDGAKAYIKQVGENKYNFIVYNSQKESVITALKNLGKKDMINLGKNYGWRI